MLSSVSVLWRETTSGFSQPAPTDHIPLTGETLPGFSQSACSDLTTTQHAPILHPVVIPQPQLRHEELIRVRRNLAEQVRNRLTLQSELISLKRSSESGLEDLTPAAKKACIYEVVKKMLEVKKGKKMAGLEEAAKNKVKHKSHAEIHPTTPPTSAKADSSPYFNWRGQGKGSRSPIAKEKSLALLHRMFGLDLSYLFITKD